MTSKKQAAAISAANNLGVDGVVTKDRVYLKDGRVMELLQKTFCIYHRADLDGKCSAAIVKRKYMEAVLVPYDYGDEIDLDRFRGHRVIMVDVSLQPFDRMVDLARLCDLTWIDHHKTAIAEHDSRYGMGDPCPPYTAVLMVGKAGCELTWKWAYPNDLMPDVVWLLGSYDCWRTNCTPVVEKFRPIRGYEGLYAISTHGRILSESKPYNNQFGPSAKSSPQQFMHPSKASSGYLQVCLKNKGEQKIAFVHKLVVETFLVPDCGLDEVNHIDGNRENNRLENLERCDRRGNLAHAGLRANGRCGVDLVRTTGKFRARVSLPDGTRKFIGNYDSEAAAVQAYDEFICAAELYRSPYNFPLNASLRDRRETTTIFWGDDVSPFQYGMRQFNGDPSDQEFWRELFDDDELLQKIIRDGMVILGYIKTHNAEICKSSFVAIIDGLTCICVNAPRMNSNEFESVWDPEKHNVMVSFSLQDDAKTWRFTLYSTKDGIDVSKTAKRFGGGGHKGAAGFQCVKLPFDAER